MRYLWSVTFEVACELLQNPEFKIEGCKTHTHLYIYKVE